jgi:tRNA (guanine-N7-)-methyltransferase
MSDGERPKPYTVDTGRRRIRSFVLRQGRFSEAQQRAFAQHWERFGLDFTDASDTAGPRDFDAVFGRHAARVLEIGFGNGEALLYAATQAPERDFIGIEVHQPGVGRLLNGLASAGLDNVRVYCHDAVEVLQQDVAESALDEVRIWFPDPWHKKRHNKRRLVQPAFVALLASRLRPGGLLHLATDWENYAEHMVEVLEASPAFVNEAGPGVSVERPPWRRETHFEARGQRLGHGVRDLLYRRRD